MTQRIEEQIRAFTEVLDAAAPPVEDLLPKAVVDEVGIQSPPLLVTATIDRSGSRLRGWQIALVTGAAIVALVVPAWLLATTINRDVVASSTTPSTAAPTTAPVEENVVVNPLNGHVFEAVSVPAGIAWEAARDAAATRTRDGVPGHLATFASADEYFHVVDNLPQAFVSGPNHNPYWIGGYQPPGSVEPGGGWAWVTGEAFTYAPWGSGEPNNSVERENCLQPHHDQNESPRWNDQPCDDATVRGYIVEYEPDS